VAFQTRCVSRGRLVLRFAGDRTFGKTVRHIHEEPRANVGQSSLEFAARVIEADRHDVAGEHGARRSSANTTRMIVTPVSASPAMMARWTGAAPRQRGRSEAWTLIKPSRGKSSNRCGRNLAVSGDDAEIGMEGFKRLVKRSAAQPLRLQDGHSSGDGLGLHRRRCHLLSAAAWPVRLGDHRDDIMPGSPERIERRHREGWRAEDDDAKLASPFAGAIEFLDLSNDQIALDASQPVEKEQAVEVIDLVLQRTGQ
jgi:hypothetical protein